MKRILVTDDERPVIESISLIVKRELAGEFEVAGSAMSGREAIEKAAALAPDIILMDVRMPGISGLDAIREIRRRGSAAVFILVTAYERFEIAREAVELGVVDYLLKPVSKDKLAQALRRSAEAIERRGAKRSGGRSSTANARRPCAASSRPPSCTGSSWASRFGGGTGQVPRRARTPGTPRRGRRRRLPATATVRSNPEEELRLLHERIPRHHPLQDHGPGRSAGVRLLGRAASPQGRLPAAVEAVASLRGADPPGPRPRRREGLPPVGVRDRAAHRRSQPVLVGSAPGSPGPCAIRRVEPPGSRLRRSGGSCDDDETFLEGLAGGCAGAGAPGARADPGRAPGAAGPGTFRTATASSPSSARPRARLRGGASWTAPGQPSP